jgi:puromycin-sensitive aminopeptidase
MSEQDDGRVLLPPTVEPSHYAIRLEEMDLKHFTYRGEEVITVQVLEETSSVTLHSKELSVSEVSFVGSTGTKVEAVSISFDLKLTTLTIIFDSILAKGEGKLSLNFTGCLNNQMAGFYRSGYVRHNGEKAIMLSTQFEALDARRCFPCWDEPARKAVFELTLVAPPGLDAISNMPELDCGWLPDGSREFHFMPSPKMSSYLVAFCVGEWDFVQSMTKHGVLIRVYTPPGKRHLGTFALKVACDTLDLYDDFFSVPYPLPKLDMIAVPEFAMGAMENWGLVTYREVDLLIDEERASSQQRQRVCTVITHELAHQWFGNLVTMTWWRALYLNEGFASWTQTYAADKLFPEWEMWQQFTVDDQSAALRLDSLRSSHPIEVPIKHAEEVEQVFDAISYCKGACVVRMIEAVLGPDMFQKGLQIYMDRHKYGNTETRDLWQAWADASGQPIKEMMSTWTDQMGHPIVEVVSEHFADGFLTLKLRQSWFLADGSDPGEEGGKKLWTIPLLTATSGTSPPMELMSAGEHTLKVPLETADGWLKLNAGQPTLMRVKYTSRMLLALRDAVGSGALSPQDRAGLVGDTYALAKAGLLPPEELISLLAAYVSEKDATVWSALNDVLVGLDKILIGNETVHKSFRLFAAKLVAPCASAVGWEASAADGHLGKLLRGTVIKLLAKFSWNDEAVQAEAKRRFLLQLSDASNSEAVPSDIASPIYQIVLKSGGREEFEQLMEIYGRADTSAERKLVYLAIGCCSTSALKKRVLNWALDEIKMQDMFYPIGSVSGNDQEGLELSWDFFQANFGRIKAMLSKASPSLMDAMIVNCCGGFADAARADEIEKFFQEHPLPNNARKLSQLLESLRINGRFMEKIMLSPLAKEEGWVAASTH